MSIWIPQTLSAARGVLLRMPVWIFFLAGLATSSSLGPGHKRPENAASSTAGSLAWRVDLRSVGFTGFAPKRYEGGIIPLEPNPLSFGDNGVLVATFITREDITALAKRDQPADLLPLRLHGVFLNANTGKVQATKEWSLTRPRGGIVAASDGRIVVLTPAMIALYSSSLELLRDYRLSSDQQSHLWNIHTSPTGKSILIDFDNPSSYQWVDVDHLQPIRTWNGVMGGHSISDRELVFSRETYLKSKGLFLYEVLIRPKDGPERTVCRVLVGQGNTCGLPEFVSNDVLSLWMPHELNLITTTSGDVVLKVGFRNDEWVGVGSLRPSANGKRFAAEVGASKGGSALLDISPHSVLKRIVVFDIPTRQLVYTLDAKKNKIKNISGLALSPDGSLMAILANGIVEVYRLPP